MKHKPFTRILSMLLAVATLVSLLAVPASAASLNGSGTVNIQYLGRHEYLSKSTGGSLSGSSWSYTSNDGLTGTAYCVNWGLSAVSPNKALTLQEYDRNPQTMGVFANGYPMRTLEQFKELHPDDVRGIANLTEDAKFLKYITPFGYTEGADIVADECLNAEYLAVGLVLTVIGISVGFYRYCKKDIF